MKGRGRPRRRCTPRCAARLGIFAVAAWLCVFYRIHIVGHVCSVLPSFVCGDLVELYFLPIFEDPDTAFFGIRNCTYTWDRDELAQLKRVATSSIQVKAMRKDIRYFRSDDLFTHTPRHYDRRYIRGFMPHKYRLGLLRALLRELAPFLERHNFAYWLQAGTLLGYHWCRDILPWDDDIDLHMMAEDLFALQLVSQMMRKHANQSGRRLRFIIDVNPHHVIRDVPQKSNAIDVRVVDTDTGLYLDVMAMREIPGTDGKLFGSKFLQPQRRPYPWFVTHTVDALFPLQRCFLGGIPVYCPFNVTKQLVQFYGNSALQATHAAYYGYVFDPRSRSFVLAK